MRMPAAWTRSRLDYNPPLSIDNVQSQRVIPVVSSGRRAVLAAVLEHLQSETSGESCVLALQLERYCCR